MDTLRGSKFYPGLPDTFSHRRLCLCMCSRDRCSAKVLYRACNSVTVIHTSARSRSAKEMLCRIRMNTVVQMPYTGRKRVLYHARYPYPTRQHELLYYIVHAWFRSRIYLHCERSNKKYVVRVLDFQSDAFSNALDVAIPYNKYE